MSFTYGHSPNPYSFTRPLERSEMTNTPAKSTPPKVEPEKKETSKVEPDMKEKDTSSEVDKKDENKLGLSDVVVHDHSGKTPAELASETPDEAAARYGVAVPPSRTDLDNPRVEVSEDDYLKQVPSGTHLHPDIAKDYRQRGITQIGTDNAQVRRGDVFVGYDFSESVEEAEERNRKNEEEKNKKSDDEDSKDKKPLFGHDDKDVNKDKK